MAIVLDGTAGITTPEITSAGGPLVVNASAPDNSVVVDASGNVGIGTSSPTFVTGDGLHVQRTGSATVRVERTGSTASAGEFFAGNDQVVIQSLTATAPLAFRTGGNPATERMRIDSSGNLLVGTTSALNSTHTFVSSSNGTISLRCSGATAGNFYRVGHDEASAFIIYNQSNIGVYLNPNATSWSANSDERVKDIIEPITNAAEKVASLRAVIGKYKNDSEGSRRAFLIAQDVQAVLPEAVNQQNDEIGTLGVQYTDVIPLLVAAIKELKAEVDSLKAQINGANV